MTKTPVMVVQELCQKKGYSTPAYEIIHCISGTHQNRFDYQVTVNGITAVGTGSSKQVSKHQAAHNLLIKLEEMHIYNPRENPVEQFQASTTSPEHSMSLNYIGPLKDICIENKIPDAVFTLVSDCGPPHKKEFTYECKVASITTIGRGNTKKMAKHLAAKEMLERIKDVLPELKIDFSKREEERQKAISDKDHLVMEKYNQIFGNVVFDKTVRVCDYSLTLKKLMVKFERTIDDFIEDFKTPSEASLESILTKLELSYNFYHMQDDPIILALNLTTDTPFTVLGVGQNLDEAREDAIKIAFEQMNVFMRLEL